MVLTARGYDFNQLLSALQKDIRRGKEYEAVFWAAELENFNSRALWNRLQVIASEDIGYANPMMPLVIDILDKQYYDACRRESDSCRIFLVDAVVVLAKSEKNRITDDLLNVVYGEIQHEDKKLLIPNYAIDKHTLKGKKMGRGVYYFFNEGTKLENEVLANPYTEIAKEILTKYGPLEKPDFTKRMKDKEDVGQKPLTDFTKPVKA